MKSAGSFDSIVDASNEDISSLLRVFVFCITLALKMKQITFKQKIMQDDW